MEGKNRASNLDKHTKESRRQKQPGGFINQDIRWSKHISEVRSTPALETKLRLGMLKQFEEQEVLERAGDPRRPEETGRVGIEPP